MIDHEEIRRKQEQERSLDVYKQPSGAMIVHTPLIRRQQILAVQRSDLENIRNFGGTGSKFSTAGMFFLSGGLWLGVDKITSWFEGPSPAIIWICGFSVLLGIVLCGVVAIFSRNKSDFITQIFS